MANVDHAIRISVLSCPLIGVVPNMCVLLNRTFTSDCDSGCRGEAYRDKVVNFARFFLGQSIDAFGIIALQVRANAARAQQLNEVLVNDCWARFRSVELADFPQLHRRLIELALPLFDNCGCPRSG